MKVFISHSQKDEFVTRRLVDIRKAEGFKVWYDKQEILPGDNWGEKIAEGLKESNAMIVLLTPDALQSDPVRWSIDYALGEKAYKQRLIPVLLGSPEEFQNDNFPWILKSLKMITLLGRGDNEEELKQVALALKAVA